MKSHKIVFILILFLVKSVFVFAQPSAKIISDDVSFCEDGVAQLLVELSGEQPYKFRYKYEEEGTIFLYPVPSDENPAVVNISFNNIEDLPATYKVELLEIWDRSNYSDPVGSTENISGEMIIQIDNKATIDIGNDDIVCGRSHTLQATSSTPTATYQWNSSEGNFNDSQLLNPTFSGINTVSSQTYSLELVASNGACKNENAVTQTVDITLKGSPNGMVTEGDEEFCAPNARAIELTFEGSDNYSYQLINTAGDISDWTSSGSSDTKSVTLQGDDTYKLHSLVDDTSNCLADVTNLIGEKKFINETPVTFAGENKIICDPLGDKTTLEASNNSNTTGVWSTSSSNINFEDSTQFNTEVSSHIYQEAELTWTETTANLGCINTATVKMLFSESPTLILSEIDDQICENSTSLLPIIVTGNSPWKLVYNNKDASFIEDITAPNYNISFSGPDQLIGDNDYTFTSIEGANGCVKYYTDLSYKLLVDEMPFPIAGEDQVVCGKEVELEALPSDIPVVGVWQGKGTFEFAGNPQTKFTALNFGEQTLEWIEVNGKCLASDDVTVDFLKAPFPVDAGNDTTIYATSAMELGALPLENGTGKWAIISGNAKINDASDPHSSISNLTEGTHVLTWTGSIRDSEVCESISDEITITSNNILAPTGISPNGDGLNDALKILGGTNIKNNKLTVFNKHGKLVYQQENYQNDWIGLDMGESPLEAGTYYYVFEGDQLKKAIRNYLIIKYDN